MLKMHAFEISYLPWNILLGYRGSLIMFFILNLKLFNIEKRRKIHFLLLQREEKRYHLLF